MRMRGKSVKKQQGNILVLFTIGLSVLLTMSAASIDGGHLLLNKSRLQNIADAAALHAAQTLDQGGSQQDAREAVIEIIGLNIAHRDNVEIADALDLSAVNTAATQVTAAIKVDFSEQPDPFTSSASADAIYVKVEIRNLILNNFLADIMNFSKRVSASALAGPSTAIEACADDLVPMLVCADDPSAGITNVQMYGLPFAELYVLKAGSASLEPGDFQLLSLGGSAADLKEAMAGVSFTNACESTIAVGDAVATELGYTVEPAEQGINTRFGNFSVSMTYSENHYPSDWNLCQGNNRVDIFSSADDAETATDASAASGDDPVLYQPGDIDPATIDEAYRYSDYENAVCNATTTTGSIDTSKPSGGDGRRILQLVIGNCTDKESGATDIPVLGTGCFFLTQTMGSGEDFIIGEFAYDCASSGKASGVAAHDPGPYTIVLYHVPGSKDS